ncbi:MAG: hypothetical protein RIR00_206 [Pseudomonadota bacterium]|jgi:predicted alpha/beta hydrolase
MSGAQAFSTLAADGYRLHGHVWRHGPGPRRPLVIINPATSVHSRYYSRFAAWLHQAGFDVLSYDYRGIGGSRPAQLRGFHAGWIEWGRLDFEAMLVHAREHFPGQPLQVVAHSVGGFLVGLAASNVQVERVFSVGAQFAYWRDYQPARRLGLLLKWHLAMPALTALCGYFPGRRLGWLEDTPRGVVQDWTSRHPRFEDGFRHGPRALPAGERQQLVARFAGLRGPTLALSLSDDEFGTIPAIERLLGYFRNSDCQHLHLTPGRFGLVQIGHFAFFRQEFAETLWPIARDWLHDGTVAPDLADGLLARPG